MVCRFLDAQEHGVRGFYGDEPVILIGIDELKRNMASTGWLQDAADLEKLEERSGWHATFPRKTLVNKNPLDNTVSVY